MDLRAEYIYRSRMIKTGFENGGQGPTTAKSVLFAAYGASHINMILPVMKKLAGRPDIRQRILALTTARPVAEAAGFDCLGFADLVGEDDHAALELGARLAAELDTRLVDDAESCAYLGLSYAELIEDHGEEGAARLFAEKGRQCFLPVRTVGRLLERDRPDLVVTTNSPRAERALVVAAGQRGIPAFPLGDLFLNSEWPWMAAPGFGVRVGVLGEYVRQHLINKGRDPEDIVVVGNPALDRLADPDVVSSGRALRKRLGWTDNSIIAWCLPFVRPGDDRIAPVSEKVGVLRAMADADPDLRVIVRAHPNQQMHFGQLPPSFVESSRDDDILAVIHAADVVLTEFSMVGFEAALAGKPVVTIGAAGTVPYGELGLSLEISDTAELEEALGRALVERTSPRLDLLGAPPVGTSTDRVVAEIDDLLATASLMAGSMSCSHQS